MLGYKRLLAMGVVTVLLWMAFVHHLYRTAIEDDQESVLGQALVSARRSYERDITYRRWAASLGGVYAMISPEVRPNPYLEVPDRDLSSTTGKQLTLINPAYMTRMVYEMAADPTGPMGHISSLAPLNPVNAPAPWERKALEGFSTPEDEFYEVTQANGQKVLHYIRPMIAEKPCLRCHAKQGYKEGDIRGGLSVTVPIQPYMAGLALSQQSTGRRYLGIFMAGMCFIAISTLVLMLNERIRNRAALTLMASERRLRVSEERHRAYVENAPLAIFITDLQGRCQDVNPVASALSGRSREHLVGASLPELFEEQSRREGRRYLARLSLVGAGSASFPVGDGQGEPRWWEISGVRHGGDRLLLFVGDITDRVRDERLKAASLREKDLLLREIHHRVKNNLQIVSSLLSLQEQGMDNDDAQRALAESRGRVTSMALIHEQLYRTMDLAAVDARSYVEELLARLASVYAGGRSIVFRTEVEPFRLNLDQAIPFGLAVNELATNAMKHGFEGCQQGTLTVRGWLEGGSVWLSVEDDGNGLDEGFCLAGITSLGLQIVPLLANQLGGELRVEPAKGARFVLRFPVREAQDSEQCAG